MEILPSLAKILRTKTKETKEKLRTTKQKQRITEKPCILLISLVFQTSDTVPVGKEVTLFDPIVIVVVVVVVVVVRFLLQFYDFFFTNFCSDFFLRNFA